MWKPFLFLLLLGSLASAQLVTFDGPANLTDYTKYEKSCLFPPCDCMYNATWNFTKTISCYGLLRCSVGTCENAKLPGSNYTAAPGERVLIPALTIGISDFLGECNEAKVSELDLYEIGSCTGNALNPSIPNPFRIFDPITGDQLAAKESYLSFFPYDSQGNFDITLIDPIKILNSVVNFPIIILNTVLELTFNAVKFLFVFSIRFIFVYLFWISLGFQAILNYLNSGHNLESEDKIHYTLAVMIAASIFTIGYGGGGILWY